MIGNLSVFVAVPPSLLWPHKKKQKENISYYSSVLYGVGFMFFSVYGAGLTWVLSWKQESFVFEGVELFKLKLIPTY